jgi:plastocyanin domain-containing protein
VDALVTQGVVRTLVLLFWMSVRYVFANILCTEYSIVASCVIGYIGVVNFWLLQDKVKSLSQQYDGSRYIALSVAVAVVQSRIDYASSVTCRISSPNS